MRLIGVALFVLTFMAIGSYATAELIIYLQRP